MEEVIGIASTTLGPLLKQASMEKWLSVFVIRNSEDSTMKTKEREIGEVYFKATIQRQTSLESHLDGLSSPRRQAQSSHKTVDFDGKSRLKELVEAELELWKQSEFSAFQDQLRRLELERMNALEAEWNKHEKERQREFTEAKEQLCASKQNVKSLLTEVESRERKLVTLQESLQRRRRDLERQHTLKVQEAEDTIKRLQRDFEEHLSLEKERTQEATAKSNQLKQQLKGLNEKTTVLESEIQQLQKSSVQSDLLILQQEVANYKTMFQGAQDRIEALEKEKVNYKTRVVELTQSLAELQASKIESNCEQAVCENKANLNLPKTDLAHQNQIDSTEIEALKQELAELKLNMASKEQQLPTHSINPGEAYCGAKSIVSSPTENEELQQLLTNRQELLDTGVYTEHDELIKQLEERIKSLS